ncbi:MAG: proton-conducting membrane transporter [Actinobacteria bacterium]|nr:proton-conducting membrane transporter [Actinomycetota bacterium]
MTTLDLARDAADRTGAPMPGPAPSILPRLLVTGPGDATHLDVHRSRFGPMPTGFDPKRMLDELERSGLTGRGGAAFPTAVKTAAVARRRGGRSVVVVNIVEGEPASSKDHHLAVTAPHLVIDGAEVLASIVGASEIHLCVDRNDWPAYGALDRAVRERAAQDRISIWGAPSHYVAGEASALSRWIGGGEARPVWNTRPDQAGVSGRPTLVQNAETVANVALVARHGAAWFRSAGTPDEPGSMLVTISGDVGAPGVLEIERGTSLRAVLDAARVSSMPRGLLVGGYGGSWIHGDHIASLSMSNASLAGVGASVGTGVIVVVGEDHCPLAETVRLAHWLAGESAGQCGPCVFGLPAIAELLERLIEDRAPSRAAERLERWLDEVDGRGACAHPDLSARMIRSALRSFADDYADHRAGRPCRQAHAEALIRCPDTEGGPWT